MPRQSSPPSRVPNACDLAYAAGIIDGEGHVGVHGGRLLLAIKMTDGVVVQWMRDTFGGPDPSERMEHRRDGTPTRPSYVWRVSGEHAARVMMDVTPYLRGKMAHASLAQAWPLVLPKDPSRRATVLQERARIRQSLRQINLTKDSLAGTAQMGEAT